MSVSTVTCVRTTTARRKHSPDFFRAVSVQRTYPSQKDAIWMIKQNGGGICWHEVGTGKTMIMCVAAYEMKRLGLVQKPLIIGLKANVHEIADTFRKAYPTAKVLYPARRISPRQPQRGVLENQEQQLGLHYPDTRPV